MIWSMSESLHLQGKSHLSFHELSLVEEEREVKANASKESNNFQTGIEASRRKRRTYHTAIKQ